MSCGRAQKEKEKVEELIIVFNYTKRAVGWIICV
jgi:hypothetical protein